MKSGKILGAGMDDRLIASIRDGATPLEKLLEAARELVGDSEGREALYDGARDHLLSEILGESGSDLAALKSAFERIGALALGMAGHAAIDPLLLLSARMDVTVHLINDITVLRDAYNFEKLRGQPHIEAAVTALHLANNQMPREALLTHLGLRQANGTRVLKLLEKARLIKRTRSNAGVQVSLTKTGIKTAMEWRSPPSTPVPSAPQPSLIMKGGSPKGMSNEAWPISTEAREQAIS